MCARDITRPPPGGGRRTDEFYGSTGAAPHGSWLTYRTAPARPLLPRSSSTAHTAYTPHHDGTPHNTLRSRPCTPPGGGGRPGRRTDEYGSTVVAAHGSWLTTYRTAPARLLLPRSSSTAHTAYSPHGTPHNTLHSRPCSLVGCTCGGARACTLSRGAASICQQDHDHGPGSSS